MKKFLFIFFLLFLIRINGEKIEQVYLEYNNIFNEYSIDVSSCNINTKNIRDIFNVKVIALYPYIEKYYEKILGNKLDYFYINDIDDLTQFNDYYFNLLEQLGHNNYKNNTKINGIKISKMIIYTKYNEFNNIKVKYKCIK